MFRDLASSSASAVVSVLPALLSMIFFSFKESIVAKLTLKARSPLVSFISVPLASSCPRVLFIRSFPKIEIIASSDSGINPGLTGYIYPISPLAARKSRLGVSAASKGVLPSSCLHGRSAIPSIMTNIPFMKI